MGGVAVLSIYLSIYDIYLYVCVMFGMLHKRTVQARMSCPQRLTRGRVSGGIKN